MKLKNIYKSVVVLAVGIFMVSCAGKDNPGLEYAPNMYHSVAYEPLKQITDEEAGAWVQIDQENSKYGEYYSSNPLNEHRMNMRTPPANTIARGKMPYRLPKDSLAAAANLVSPFPADDEKIAKEGKVLFEKFCMHCHGPKGEGDGPVAGTEEKVVFAGIANLKSAAIKDKPEGHIFHVITHGKGMMGSHASQLNPDERWKIARYVKQLQK